jgi:hypothetical protein
MGWAGHAGHIVWITTWYKTIIKKSEGKNLEDQGIDGRILLNSIVTM